MAQSLRPAGYYLCPFPSSRHFLPARPRGIGARPRLLGKPQRLSRSIPASRFRHSPSNPRGDLGNHSDCGHIHLTCHSAFPRSCFGSGPYPVSSLAGHANTHAAQLHSHHSQPALGHSRGRPGRFQQPGRSDCSNLLQQRISSSSSAKPSNPPICMLNQPSVPWGPALQAFQYGLWPNLRPVIWSHCLWMLEYNGAPPASLVTWGPEESDCISNSTPNPRRVGISFPWFCSHVGHRHSLDLTGEKVRKSIRDQLRERSMRTKVHSFFRRSASC